MTFAAAVDLVGDLLMMCDHDVEIVLRFLDALDGVHS